MGSTGHDKTRQSVFWGSWLFLKKIEQFVNSVSFNCDFFPAHTFGACNRTIAICFLPAFLNRFVFWSLNGFLFWRP